MKNFTLKTITFLILILTSFHSFTQERTCGMEDYMQEMLQDPGYAKEYQESQQKFNTKLQEFLSQQDINFRNNTIEIPVAVHFPDGNETDRACLEVMAQNQIDILNADFSATNTDISIWNNSVSSFFPNTDAGVANISFCLATSNHPVGLDTNLIEGNPAITIGYNFGNGNNRDSNWAGYLNFVVRNLGVLGFSPLGGRIALGDAVTIDNNAFGSGAVPGCAASGVSPSAPYNLGRTTTHELGHFFNLRHTFNGDGNGVCGNGGDFIEDTPEVANSTYGCPPPTATQSCVFGQPALTMNYMDYVNDACMYMFSEGQINVAEAWIASNVQPHIRPDACEPVPPGFLIATEEPSVFSCPTSDSEAVFTFSYTTVSNFAETTTFSADNLPSGATVNFSPASLSDSGNVTMTVGNLGSVAEGNFTIDIIGTAPTVTETLSVVLNNICTEVICETYASEEDLGLAIPDAAGGFAGSVSDVINISESVIIESITLSVDVSHTWISDLRVYILPPGASTFPDDAIILWNNECAVSGSPGIQNFSVTFDDAGADFPGTNGCNDDFTGVYKPNQPLNTFTGTDAQGNWELAVLDFASGDTGTLDNWSIEICSRELLNVSKYEINNVSVFPNPNNGEFNLTFNSNSGDDVSIDVFDIRGRTILSETYKSSGRFEQTLNLDNAQSGIYLLSIKNGMHKVTKKIIVD